MRWLKKLSQSFDLSSGMMERLGIDCVDQIARS